MTIVLCTTQRLAISSLIAIAFYMATLSGANAQSRGIGIGIGTGMMILKGLSNSAKSGSGKSRKSYSSTKSSKKTYAAKKKSRGSRDDDDAPAKTASESKTEGAAAENADTVAAAPTSAVPAGAAAAAGGAAIATGSTSEAADVESPTISTPSEIKAAQEHLKYMGYEVPEINGKVDLKTKIAVMQFQDSLGEESTGSLTIKQLQTLFLKVSQRTAATK